MAYIEAFLPREFDIQSDMVDSCYGFETYEIMKDPEIMREADKRMERKNCI